MKKLTATAALAGLFLASCSGQSSSPLVPAPTAQSNTTMPGAPLNAAAGAPLNAPLGTSPNAPLGASPNAPLGTPPNAPLGASPNAPHGATYNAPLGAQLSPRPRSGDFAGFVDGQAFAASATLRTNAGIAEISGPIADATLGCRATPGTDQNSVQTIDALPFAVSTGTAKDIVTTSRTATTGNVTSTSTIAGISLLNGLIKASAVVAEANSNANATSATSDAQGSKIAGLVIAGKAIDATPPANTQIDLPGLGYVVLNEQLGPVNGTTTTHIYVRMIHVYVTASNTLGVKPGTEVIVGSAYSSFTVPPAPFQINTAAYSLYARGVNNDIHATSGPWSIVGLSCNSNSDTSRLAQANTPVGTLGAMVDTATANESKTATATEAKSNTAGVNLLSGLIAAHGLVADALVRRNGSAFTRTGSLQFASLTLAGKTVSANVAPNTRVNLAGLGYAIVNSQQGSIASGSASEEVNAIVVYVTQKNTYNLPVGAEIVVGHAHAGISQF